MTTNSVAVEIARILIEAQIQLMKRDKRRAQPVNETCQQQPKSKAKENDSTHTD